MDSSSNNLRGAREILEAIVAKLKALELDGGPAGEKAFARVEIFDLVDWKAAVRRLVFNDNRAALVVYDGDSFEQQREMTVLTIDRKTRVDVMITGPPA